MTRSFDAKKMRWVVVGILAAAAAGSALADRQYDVTHNFRLRPGGNIVPNVNVEYYAWAWVQEFDPPCSESATRPVAQPPGHPDFGRAYLRSKGRVRVNRLTGGSGTDANKTTIAIPPAGFGPMVDAASAETNCASKSRANVRVQVDPYGAGTDVTGQLRVWGYAHASRAPRAARAYAFSMAQITAQGGRQLRNGTIRWGRVVRDTVSGSALESRQRDPIEYRVTDLVTGDVYTGTLLSIKVDARSNGAGTGFDWSNNTVAIGSDTEVHFEVDMTSPYTSAQGYLRLVTQNNVVRESVATGVYAGTLPPVGTLLPVAFPLDDEIEFDYDLGDFDGHDLDVEINMNGNGESEDEAAWDPLSLATIDMNEQINMDPNHDPTFDAITTRPPNFLEFVGPNPMDDLDGYARHIVPFPGHWTGPTVNLLLAGVGPVSIADPTATLRVDMRVFHDAFPPPPGSCRETMVGLQLATLGDDGTVIGIRDYGPIAFVSRAFVGDGVGEPCEEDWDDLPYPQFNGRTIYLASPGSDPFWSHWYQEWGAFDPNAVGLIEFYTQRGGGGEADVVELKRLEISQAAESPPVELPGDLNCDGVVDFDDIDPFVMALSSPTEYEATYPDCNWLNGDIDGNGVVDFDDIDPFVELLSGN